MATTKIKIGEIPIGRGEWNASVEYYKENTVTLYDMSFRAKQKVGKGVAPAVIGSEGKVALRNTDVWELTSGNPATYNTANDIEKLSHKVDNIKPIVINGNVTNAPDEEDITFDGNNLLKLKDRSAGNGMGYVILRTDKTFVEQVTQPNTIYEIRYDFDLGGEEVILPTSCILSFQGGSVSNGSVVCDETNIIGNYQMYNIIHLTGSLVNRSIDLANIHFTSDANEVMDAFSLQGLKEIKFKNKRYENVGRLIQIQNRDSLVINCNGAIFEDERASNVDIYPFLEFINCNQIIINDFNYKGQGCPIEGDVAGVRVINLDNCHNYTINGCIEDAAVGVRANGSDYNDKSILNLRTHNVGYSILLQGLYINNVEATLFSTGFAHRFIYLCGVVDSKFSLTTNNVSVSPAFVLITNNSQDFAYGDPIRGICDNLDISICSFGTISTIGSGSISLFSNNYSRDIDTDESKLMIKNPRYRLSAHVYGTINGYVDILGVISSGKYIPHCDLNCFVGNDYNFIYSSSGDAIVNINASVRDGGNVRLFPNDDTNASLIKVYAPEQDVYFRTGSNSRVELNCSGIDGFSSSMDIDIIMAKLLLPKDDSESSVTEWTNNISRFKKFRRVIQWGNDFFNCNLTTYRWVLAQCRNAFLDITKTDDTNFTTQDNYPMFTIENIVSHLPRNGSVSLIVRNSLDTYMTVRFNQATLIHGNRDTLLKSGYSVLIKIHKINGTAIAEVIGRPLATRTPINGFEGDTYKKIGRLEKPIYKEDGKEYYYDGNVAYTSRKGATSSRPSPESILAGYFFYDESLKKPIWWNGTSWVDATGATV